MKTGKTLSLVNLFVTLLLFVSLSSFGQSRQEKTDTIIHKFNFVEMPKVQYQYQLEPLKQHATGSDSLKLIELENQLTEERILKVINSAFKEHLSDAEVDDVYNFLQSSAYDKLFVEGLIFKFIDSHYSYMDKEIDRITNKLDESIKSATPIFKPIPIDREDGFYATVDYNRSDEDKDVKLEEKPSLTSKDIKEAKKISFEGMYPEIAVQFTKEGAQKLYLLTKENIGKPLAIVIAKQIVSMPTINVAVMHGRASIAGSFTDEDIDKMIERLKEKE